MTLKSDDIYCWSIIDLLYKAGKITYENQLNTFAIFLLKHVVWYNALFILKVLYNCSYAHNVCSYY